MSRDLEGQLYAMERKAERTAKRIRDMEKTEADLRLQVSALQSELAHIKGQHRKLRGAEHDLSTAQVREVLRAIDHAMTGGYFAYHLHTKANAQGWNALRRGRKKLHQTYTRENQQRK